MPIAARPSNPFRPKDESHRRQCSVPNHHPHARSQRPADDSHHRNSGAGRVLGTALLWHSVLRSGGFWVEATYDLEIV
ncbi:hypothetical protein NBRGN_052_00240 [Nocardia brasiliensis NBRC 14402]|nr:hypothetical protein NBRGN_052_00240 [Nocardia brasiliensis NBRC 14402]